MANFDSVKGANENIIGTGITITLSTNYTAPSDGYVTVATGGYQAGKYARIKTSDNLTIAQVSNPANSNAVGAQSCSLFVRKGTVIKCEGDADAIATFYPLQ